VIPARITSRHEYEYATRASRNTGLTGLLGKDSVEDAVAELNLVSAHREEVGKVAEPKEVALRRQLVPSVFVLLY
jgi:hypothetical protein